MHSPRAVGADAAGPASQPGAPDWSRLHVDSCLGRGRLINGRMVFTGEGYDPSMDLAPDSTPPERGGTPHRRAEDLASFPPQFPLASGGGLLCKLGSAIAPRFADLHFEGRYRQHRAKGLDAVQLGFAISTTGYVCLLWIYYLADNGSHGFDRQVQVALYLLHAALFVAWCAWLLLRRLPCARRRGSELQAVQVAVLVALFCWGLPATARRMCSDTYNTFDGNLQQTLFVARLPPTASPHAQPQPHPTPTHSPHSHPHPYPALTVAPHAALRPPPHPHPASIPPHTPSYPTSCSATLRSSAGWAPTHSSRSASPPWPTSSPLGACGAASTTSPSPSASKRPSSSPRSSSSAPGCAAQTCTSVATSLRAS